MKNFMIILLCFMVIICMDAVFGMDNYSEKPESSNGEDFIDLTQYTKQELSLDNLNSNFEKNAYDQKNLINAFVLGNYKPEVEYCINNVSNTSEKNVNGLKRKQKPEKTLLCEVCQKESNRYIKGKFSGQCLCNACYAYEFRHGAIGPQNERYYTGKHKDQILVCDICQKESNRYITGKFSRKSLCQLCYGSESRHGALGSQVKQNYNRKHKNQVFACGICQKESNRYITGKFSRKSLCKACYNSESRHGGLGSQVEQNYNGKHKDQILVCENCQKQSNRYIKGKFSGKSLCDSCYRYEYRHGGLKFRGEQRHIGKHNQVLVCEFCQRKSKQYRTGIFSGQSLCYSCYQYESKHGALGPQDERNYKRKHKDQILVCENCQEESKQYVTGKFSGKSLCQACYQYEFRHAGLGSQSERDYNEKHKDQRNNSSNRLFDAVNSQNKDINDSTNHITEQHKKHE